MQVTIIGGGSYQWTPTLMTDLLATPSLAGCHLVLMDIDPTPLPKMAALVTRANEALGLDRWVRKHDRGPRGPGTPRHPSVRR
jgi:alpha-galactosidase/6-phospho-beta-glucosidase family protein